MRNGNVGAEPYARIRKRALIASLINLFKNMCVDIDLIAATTASAIIAGVGAKRELTKLEQKKHT